MEAELPYFKEVVLTGPLALPGESRRDAWVVQTTPRRVQQAAHPLASQLGVPPSQLRRGLDILIATIALILLAPVGLIVAIAIKLTSPGPVFFIQERTGLNLRRFRMYKFRTMVPDAGERLELIRHLNEMTGPLIKINNDPRLTPIGGLLRKTSLDELPQLLNVLKGDMTLIGPRALSPLPSQYEPWQLRRFAVTPGLACIWQAERRAERNFTEWMRSDLRYIDSKTPRFDFRLVIKVLWRVILCSGAS